MTTTADRSPTESHDELRRRIPGWGVDLDPADRPQVPRLQYDPAAAARAADIPQQPEAWPRERSIEHRALTPVFGTSCPPKGVSGAMRRYSYARFSEARAAHWLILLAADRVDALGHHVRSLASLRPDNPLTQTGVRSEVTHHGVASRLRTKRADLAHQPLDPVIVVAPWALAGGLAYRGAKAVMRRRRAA